MKDYKAIQNEITELRNILISYQNFDNTTQDLMEQFFKVKEVSPEIYELLILLYNEFQLSNKSNRKQMLELMTKLLNVKNKTITKIIEEKAAKTNNFFSVLTWQNIKRTFSLWIIAVTFLFMLSYINNEAFTSISTHFDKFFEEMLTIIKYTTPLKK